VRADPSSAAAIAHMCSWLHWTRARAVSTGSRRRCPRASGLMKKVSTSLAAVRRFLNDSRISGGGSGAKQPASLPRPCGPSGTRRDRYKTRGAGGEGEHHRAPAETQPPKPCWLFPGKGGRLDPKVRLRSARDRGAGADSVLVLRASCRQRSASLIASRRARGDRPGRPAIE